MLPLAVLCGGLGTRMRPHTLQVPKPMIDVNGEPFLAHLLRSVATNGVRDVVLLIGYLGEAIVEFAGDGAAYGLRLTYVRDGEVPLGTAGAVRSALAQLGERFLLTYGDALLLVDYRAVIAAFERSLCTGLMTVYRSAGLPERPNTAVNGTRVVRYDKEAASPDLQYVDYGLSAFHSSAFAKLPAGLSIDLTVVNCDLIARGELASFIVDAPPYEIGSPDGLRATEAYLRRNF